MKLKKKRKSKNMRGGSTHGWGSRKKHLGSGHRGGFGMAGTGKRADHKKSLILKLYGSDYFGKQGVTSRKTERRVNKIMNLKHIGENLDSLKKQFEKNGVLDLSKYKILGEGDAPGKIAIKAAAASESAKKKIESAGGKLILPQKTPEKSIKEEH